MKSFKQIQEKAWNELENIKIIQSNGGGTVAIYFTSNNLYYPNTVECFENTIYKKDRYEWTNLKINRASKHIFVRDVYKRWYITGVNAQISSISLLLEKLKKEVAGYSEIVTIGSSAGGYAASLFGSLLNANLVFDFNGQWELNSAIRNNGYRSLESLRKKCGVYYDIVPLIRNSDHIFYFVSMKSKWDMEQDEYSHSLNMNRIYFSTSHHGIPFLKIALPIVLNLKREQLEKLVYKTYNPIFFTMKLCGIFPTIICFFKGLVSKIKRKIKYF